MSLYYADTSAVMNSWPRRRIQRLSRRSTTVTMMPSGSVALLRIEVTRTVLRATPALLPDARDLLLAFSYIAIDDDVVDGAMSEPDRGLRSLDAIHLATARVLAPELDGLLTYDDRLDKAATDAGLLGGLSPRD